MEMVQPLDWLSLITKKAFDLIDHKILVNKLLYVSLVYQQE